LAACLGEDQRPTVLVVLRNRATDFLIVKGTQPLLVRSVDEGVTDLAKREQISEDLLTEAKRSLEFCRTRYADQKPRLWLCPGPMQDPEVSAALLARLKSEVDTADVDTMPSWPDAGGGAANAPGATQAWAAVGTAMIDLPGYEIVPHMNLVPSDWPEIERVQKQLMHVAASVACAILATVAVVSLLKLATNNTAKYAEAASVPMMAGTNDVKKAAEMKRQASEAVARVNLWKDVRAEVKPFDWSAGLEAVLAQVPPGVRVTQFSYRRGTLRLVGEAQSTDLVHQLVQKLNRLPNLEEANIERLVRSSGPGGSHPGFTISCRFGVQTRPSAEGKAP
jgi:hypothetical protein